MKKPTILIAALVLLFLSHHVLAQPTIDWSKTFGGSGSEQGWSVLQTADLGYIISGTSNSNDGDVGSNNGDFDYWILKLNQVGEMEWEKNYGGSDNEFSITILQASSSGYCVAGYSNSNDGDIGESNDFWNYWLLKLNATGDIEWEKNFGGSDIEHLKSIEETSDEGFVLFGNSVSNDGDVGGNYGAWDFWGLKINQTGDIEWEMNFGGSEADFINSIQQTSDGEFILAGSTFSNDGDIGNNNGLTDVWIMKFGQPPVTTEKPSAFNLNIFPNPSDGNILLQLENCNNTPTTLKIIDLDGRLLKQKDFGFSNGEVNFDFSGFPSGIYFLQVQTEDTQIVRKLILQK